LENKIKIGDIVLIENRRGQVAKIKIQGSNTRILCLIGDERKIVFSKELEWNKITSLWKYKKGEK
jgi:hypothetical protein